MSAGCVRWLLNYSARVIPSVRPVLWSPLSRPNACKDKPGAFTLPFCRSTFCTTKEDAQPTPGPEKKKQSKQSNAPIRTVGRMIPHRLIQVIGESGDNMGVMHRSDAIKLMDKQERKLVLLSNSGNPPVYKLMTGRQIHEEQLKLREREKAKPAPVQVKELNFTSNIGTQDLSTKLRQVESWLEKKHHVKIIIKARPRSTENMDTHLEGLLQQMEVDYGFVSTPKEIQDGKAAMCTLRPLSAKELAKKSKKTQTTEVSSESPSAKDTTETSVQP